MHTFSCRPSPQACTTCAWLSPARLPPMLHPSTQRPTPSAQWPRLRPTANPIAGGAWARDLCDGGAQCILELAPHVREVSMRWSLSGHACAPQASLLETLHRCWQVRPSTAHASFLFVVTSSTTEHRTKVMTISPHCLRDEGMNNRRAGLEC